MNTRTTATDNPIEALSRLTGGLAHEIRNPLSTLRVNLQLLAEDLRELDTQQDGIRRSLNRVELMHNEVNRLSEILDDFIRFVSRRPLDLQVFDVNNVIGQLVAFYEPQAAEASVRIMTNYHPRPLRCRVDADLFKQALLNLLLNAQQAMPEGGDLMIRTQSVGDRARIDVADTGIGIPADQIGNIFQAYFSTKKAGTGLGLAMTQRIVGDHHGEIQVTSPPGKGTHFSITLPLCQPSPENGNP